MAHCLLQAPTVEITRMLQSDIVVWLSEVGKARALVWFNDTWSGERGNYTHATAGYVGNNLSSGIESNWRYMRRDVVGCAGATQSISLEVFMPSLIHEAKHADKILCPKTGAHVFPSEVMYIPSKIWEKIPDFKVCTSSYESGTQGSRSKGLCPSKLSASCVSMLTVWVHIPGAETLCVATASSDVGVSRRQESSSCFPHRWHRSTPLHPQLPAQAQAVRYTFFFSTVSQLFPNLLEFLTLSES